MPPIPYNIEGKIRTNSLIKGSAEIEHTIDTNKGGQTGLDLYIGGGTTTAVVTVNIKNLTTNKEITIDSNSSGEYLYDLANLEDGYSDEDVLLIRVSTYTTNDTDVFTESRIIQKDTYNETAKAIKNSLVDGYGNEFNSQNPLPTKPITEDFTGLNYSLVWTHDSSGRMITETRTYKGKSIRRTWTFTGNNYYADSHSGWIEV